MWGKKQKLKVIHCNYIKSHLQYYAQMFYSEKECMQKQNAITLHNIQCNCIYSKELVLWDSIMLNAF